MNNETRARAAVQTGQKLRTSDAVAAELRRMIMSQELMPGTVFSEQYLSDLLGCSRTPMRDAIQRLSQEYLVTAQPRRGISVTPLSITDLIEVQQLMELLVDLNARLAAERINAEQLAELEGVVRQMEEAGAEADWTSAAMLDFEFHRIVAEASGTRYLADVLTPLHRLTARFSYVGFSRRKSVVGATADHRVILEALRARDGDRAAQGYHAHLASGRKRIQDAM